MAGKSGKDRKKRNKDELHRRLICMESFPSLLPLCHRLLLPVPTNAAGSSYGCGGTKDGNELPVPLTIHSAFIENSYFCQGGAVLVSPDPTPPPTPPHPSLLLPGFPCSHRAPPPRPRHHHHHPTPNPQPQPPCSYLAFPALTLPPPPTPTTPYPHPQPRPCNWL